MTSKLGPGKATLTHASTAIKKILRKEQNVDHSAAGNRCPIYLQEIERNKDSQLKILQINLARDEEAMNNLQKAVASHNFDVVVAQELLVRKNGIAGIPQKWDSCLSKNKKAAILLINRSLRPIALTAK
ncbi:hypothetical protein AVEN_88088-1 [Araneus ventricosus]|uniref:Endonuclease/exonuclease/phosphatase domain-containing protein n=1 Tax=Araneus ventricosus TaxID=182803 RepID=A0A4Y2NDW2_ARAVE|nr:hypothetical protein AVEN_88088-1 [Araneus ventricosus]